MKFQHRIPNIYYSCTDDIEDEREELELKTVKKKFADYNISTSRGLFRNDDDWYDGIESIIEGTDIVIFSYPDEWQEGYFVNEKFERELNLATKKRRVVYIIVGSETGLLSDRNWVNRPF